MDHLWSTEIVNFSSNNLIGDKLCSRFISTLSWQKTFKVKNNYEVDSQYDQVLVIVNEECFLF